MSVLTLDRKLGYNNIEEDYEHCPFSNTASRTVVRDQIIPPPQALGPGPGEVIVADSAGGLVSDRLGG